VAVDVAIGAAYSGRRALAAMKHVGLNVAADSLMSASMTGVEAGLVLVSADDPHMHSSQNEQDNRRYARFASVPCLEPSDSQEAKEMAGLAFEISEQFDTPVILRLTTRICHSSSPVDLGQRVPVDSSPAKFPRDPLKYVLLSSHSRKKPPLIAERTRRLSELAETLVFIGPIPQSQAGERRSSAPRNQSRLDEVLELDISAASREDGDRVSEFGEGTDSYLSPRLCSIR
jgi:indolepyruvate ferredoxin oxidoreductase alpha subunit